MFPSARSAAGIGLRGLFAIVACMQGAWPSRVAADFDAPITATWNGIGLREWAGRLGQSTGVPVLVDRHLDPDTSIRLDCRDEPLVDVVDRGAEVAGGEVAALRSSLCIVPAGKATVLVRAEAARETRLSRLPPRQRATLGARRRMAWPAGATPRDLIATTATQAGVVIEGLDVVPHDHLAALALPEMTLAEQLDVLLAPFDLRVDWRPPTGGRTAVAPSGTIIAIDAGLTAPMAATSPSDAKSPRRRPSAAPKQVVNQPTFSMQVAAPLEELLTTIAPRLGLTLELDRESLERSGIAPAEIVRATVKDASRDELIEALLTPLGLTWSITGDTLRVQAPAR